MNASAAARCVGIETQRRRERTRCRGLICKSKAKTGIRPARPQSFSTRVAPAARAVGIRLLDIDCQFHVLALLLDHAAPMTRAGEMEPPADCRAGDSPN